MKNLLVMIAMCLMVLPACADDKPIKVEDLPAAAREFIAQHFPSEKIAYAKMDRDNMKKNYDVAFMNGNKIDFDNKGRWTEIDCSRVNTQVPVSVIPPAIATYISTNYKDSFTKKIERNKFGYEVTLDNKLELKFDPDFNFIGFDD